MFYGNNSMKLSYEAVKNILSTIVVNIDPEARITGISNDYSGITISFTTDPVEVKEIETPPKVVERAHPIVRPLAAVVCSETDDGLPF